MLTDCSRFCFIKTVVCCDRKTCSILKASNTFQQWIKKLNMTTKTWLSWSGCWHLNKWMHPFHSCCSFPSLCLPLIVPLSPPPLILTFIWAWLAKAQRNTSAFPFKWCYLLSSVWAPPYRSLLPPFPPSPTSSHAQPSAYFPCHLVSFMFRPASSSHLFFSHFHFITCPWL